MQVATDAAALLFLGFDQMSGEALKFLVALIEAGFRCLLRAHIADHADDKRRATVIAIEKGNADKPPHLRAIVAKEALFQPVAGSETLAQLFKKRLLDLLVFRMADSRAACTQELFRGIAEHGAKGRVDLEDATFHGLEGNANRSLGEQIPEAFLAFLAGSLGVLALQGSPDNVCHDGQLMDGLLGPRMVHGIVSQSQNALSVRAVVGRDQKQGFEPE